MKDRIIIEQKPLKGEDGYRTFSIRIKKNTLWALDEIAVKTGRSRNSIIMKFIEYGVKNCELLLFRPPSDSRK